MKTELEKKFDALLEYMNVDIEEREVTVDRWLYTQDSYSITIIEYKVVPK